MRILFATDLHGSETHYRTVFAAAFAQRADLVLLGGDLSPDFSFPLAQRDWVEKYFAAWVREFRQAGGCPVAGITGNHETTAGVEALRQVEGFDLLNRGLSTLAGLNLAGFELAPPSPFMLKDHERRDLTADGVPGFTVTCQVTRDGGAWQYITEAEHFLQNRSLEEELERFPLPDGGETILLAHSPPWGGVLDRLPGGILCGSKALRRYLEAHQPALSLHGHIHESPWTSGHCSERIGRTLCINPGQQAEPTWCSFDPADVAGTWRHSHGRPL